LEVEGEVKINFYTIEKGGKKTWQRSEEERKRKKDRMKLKRFSHKLKKGYRKLRKKSRRIVRNIGDYFELDRQEAQKFRARVC